MPLKANPMRLKKGWFFMVRDALEWGISRTWQLDFLMDK